MTKDKFTIGSIVVSLIFGLALPQGYQSLVTGLNPILSLLLILFFVTLVIFDIFLIWRSSNKTIVVVLFLIFAIVLPVVRIFYILKEIE